MHCTDFQYFMSVKEPDSIYNEIFASFIIIMKGLNNQNKRLIKITKNVALMEIEV